MQALVDFNNELENMYAYHVEISSALLTWNAELKRLYNGSPTQKMWVGRDGPNNPDKTYQYAKFLTEIISTSSKNGAHANTLSRSVIALTYSIWEDKYRARIAHECQKDTKNEIESDVFHDLNKYRQAVLHAGGRLVGNPKVMKFCKSGEEVLLSEKNIHDMFVALTNELNRIGRDYYGQDPGFSLNKPMRSG